MRDEGLEYIVCVSAGLEFIGTGWDITTLLCFLKSTMPHCWSLFCFLGGPGGFIGI